MSTLLTQPLPKPAEEEGGVDWGLLTGLGDTGPLTLEDRELHELGRHILVELYGCEPATLNDMDVIRREMLRAAELSGATIVGDVFHRFQPHGVSGAVVIAESHLSIHTWPEYRYAALDLFTCGSNVNPWIGFDHLYKVLRAERSSQTEIRRGLFPADPNRDYPYKPNSK